MRHPIYSLEAPICAVCRRTVDEFVTWTDNLRAQLHMRAKCHGDVEDVVLTEELLEDASVFGMGEAFTTKALPQAPPKELPP